MLELAELLILFFVLFFPGVYSSGFSGGEAQPFIIYRELGRTLTYTAPSLALLWYIITDKKGFKRIKLKIQDLVSLSIGLLGLVILGLGVSVLVSIFSHYEGLNPPEKVEAPANALGWAVMVISCIGTGYLEECYFRYYLLTKLENTHPSPVVRIIFSTFLFSICHIYEGPWGAFNAALAGILLSVIFIRYRSFHGIAWAHGAYNIFVYIAGNFSL